MIVFLVKQTILGEDTNFSNVQTVPLNWGLAFYRGQISLFRALHTLGQLPSYIAKTKSKVKHLKST